MSLDVDLYIPGTCGPRRDAILVREGGETKEITREEWDRRFPGREPVIVEIGGDEEVYSANITHNLNSMASAAGIYKHLWRPEEIGVTKAEQLIDPLAQGLEALRADPEKFKSLNPENGWGSYEGLVRFVEAYLGACREHPQALVRACR